MISNHKYQNKTIANVRNNLTNHNQAIVNNKLKIKKLSRQTMVKNLILFQTKSVRIKQINNNKKLNRKKFNNVSNHIKT